MKKKLKVVELFAGVGGFRLGLEGYKGLSSSSGYKEPIHSYYEVVWSNQYEPTSKKQWAAEIYSKQFGKQNKNFNVNIEEINAKNIPDCDVLVGGFPCQDYSVANSLRTAKGILGKKGILWWQIERIISKKQKKPKYLILENVDRLLKSPVYQKGRDFAVMLASLNNLGYVVEWRIINAADFGFPQKRRRVFILAYLGTKNKNIFDYQFKASEIKSEFTFDIKESLQNLSKKFGKGDRISKFLNSGVCIDKKVTSMSLKYEIPKKPTLLKNILIKESSHIDDEFWIHEKVLPKWQEGKNARSINRISMRDGKPFNYKFSEGSMSFPDKLDSPARTIITSEGGNAPARNKHIIKHRRLYLPNWLEELFLALKIISNKRVYRRLTALELERLNMFPNNHTKIENITNSKRAFLMGNALVVGVVERIGSCIKENERDIQS